MSSTLAPASASFTRSLAGPMALLGSGVPLTLLFDLAFGPRSEELLRTERPHHYPPEPRLPA